MKIVSRARDGLCGASGGPKPRRGRETHDDRSLIRWTQLSLGHRLHERLFWKVYILPGYRDEWRVPSSERARLFVPTDQIG